MPGCAAFNCTSHSRKNVRLFRFPRETDRRRRWEINCRRDKWHATDASRLCENHFEDDQYERLHVGGLRKLKQNAVPTVFDVPNPPKKLQVARPPRKRHAAAAADVSTELSQDSYVHDHGYFKRQCLDVSDLSGTCMVDSEPAGAADPVIRSEYSYTIKLRLAQSKIRRLQRENHVLRHKLDELHRKLDKVFNADQIHAMENRSRGTRWTPNTIKKALQIRYACGSHGYEFLRQIDLPVPAYRTLCDHVQQLQLAPGIDVTMLDMLSTKLSVYSDSERDCCLLIDEVQLKEKVEYDKGLKCLVGKVSADIYGDDKADCLASHALCYMVRGIRTNWKQIVAWYATGTATPGTKQWDIAKKIVQLLHDRGVTVRAVVSDMGPNNQAMWKHVGVYSRKDALINSIQHPSDNKCQLYFLADVPHLLKNLRNMLLTHSVTVPEILLQRYSLPAAKVSLEHVKQLVHIQDDRDLKVVPGLTQRHLEPAKFQKMRVGVACKLFSRSCSAGLTFLVEAGQLPRDALTTAWFLNAVNDWFDVMSSRCGKTALYRGSVTKLHKLYEMLELICGMRFSDSSTWKPVQAGIKLSTTSVLNIHGLLMESADTRFLLTSRLNQDALENVFSQVRGKGDTHPSMVGFRQNLRAVCLSQFMSVPKTAVYHVDNTPHLLEFMKKSNRSSDEGPHDEIEVMDAIMNSAISDVDIIDENVIAYVCGWLAFKAKKHFKDCTECCSSALAVGGADDPALQLLNTKSLGKLCVPSTAVVEFISGAECVFRQLETMLVRAHDVEKLLVNAVKNDSKCSAVQFPLCHNIRDLLLMRYVKLRLHAYASKLSQSTSQLQHASKSAAARTIIK